MARNTKMDFKAALVAFPVVGVELYYFAKEKLSRGLKRPKTANKQYCYG